MSLLNKINLASDLKHLSDSELDELASEIRQEIISVVSQNGGHLASNLGAVELTLALHYCLDVPTDQIVWDVGHQSYVHKIVTGRREELASIRKYEGISGFPKRTESEADPFGAGHASTAISAALGLAAARDHRGLNHKVVAVIGDGAMTGGLAYEGLNNAGATKRDMIVILNDNNMSISKNVGAMSKHLTGIMVDQRYNRLRNEIWDFIGRFRRKDKIRKYAAHLEDSLKSFIVPGIFFDRLGFRYFGPIDGHDIPLMIKTIDQIKELKGPRLLHVLTTKGKGYAPAEKDATKYHGIGSFDKLTGRAKKKKALPSYTSVFGDTLCQLAEANEKVVAITAAMTSGTGLTKFSERFPDRFYDVGIAEEHAACFASGLAAGGMRPFLALYSTFLQRAYDQVIHDAALQKLPVIFCVDRAGLVGEDGPTHHGAYDLSYLQSVPGLTVMAPKDGDEFRAMLHYAATTDLEEPVAIRYPRASIPHEMSMHFDEIEWGKWETLSESDNVCVIAAGSMVEIGLRAKEILDGKTGFGLVNARFIKPLDTDMLERIAERYRNIITIEENSVVNGFGSTVGSYLKEIDYPGGFTKLGIPDKFVPQGPRAQLLTDLGLTPESLAGQIRAIAGERDELHDRKEIA